jgi:hypothetical protein
MIVYPGEGSINTGGGPSPAETLFTEDFDDLNFSSRGWFDGSPSSGVIDTSTKYSGAGAMKWTWPSGSKTPAGMQTIRKDFTPSDELYTSFYWRFNSDWRTDTGLANWPHLIYILSDADDHWGGLARNVLDTYVEVEGIIPKLHIQDGENIDTNPTPPWSNTGGTEDRAVAGCNGNTTGADVGTGVTCYQSGSIWMNSRWWDGMSTFSLNSWQHVEVYLKMNSVSGGVGQSDGTMRLWVDGAIMIDKNNVIYRTNKHPNLKWATFVLGPYIGTDAIQTETMWMDELTIATGYHP